MTKANESAFPRKEECVVGPNQRILNEHGGVLYNPGQTYLREHPGLTKRELFAAMAMQALIAKLPVVDFKGEYGFQLDAKKCDQFKTDVADSARGYADALLKELERETK